MFFIFLEKTIPAKVRKYPAKVRKYPQKYANPKKLTVAFWVYIQKWTGLVQISLPWTTMTRLDGSQNKKGALNCEL